MNHDISSTEYPAEGEAGELFLDECLDLYEELEDSLICVETMTGDIEIAAEEIREAMDAIGKRMLSCEERLNILIRMERRKASGFQNAS